MQAFWDGGRAVLILFQPARMEDAMAYSGGSVRILSHAGSEFVGSGALLDIVEFNPARRVSTLLELPPQHSALRIEGSDGAALTIELTHLNEPRSGANQILSIRMPDAELGDGVSLIESRAFVDQESFVALQRRSGKWTTQGIWALLHARRIERDNQIPITVEISASKRIYPTIQRQLVFAAREWKADGRVDRKGRLAIHNTLGQEYGGRGVSLTLRIEPGASDELLGDVTVAHVMNQRRVLARLIRERRAEGDRVMDPLSLNDVRKATGYSGGFSAVESKHDIIAFNLAQLIAKPSSEKWDGVDIVGGERSWDIVFPGATLGDYVGLLCPYAPNGALVVEPESGFAGDGWWFFRVDLDGLIPIDIGREPEEPFLVDPPLPALVLRLQNKAAELGASGETKEPVRLPAMERQSAFLQHTLSGVADADAIRQLDVGAPRDLFWPMRAIAFAQLQKSRLNAQSLRSRYGRFREDAAVERFVAARPHLRSMAAAPDVPSGREPSASLPQRVAERLGMSGLVAAPLNLAGQVAACRMLDDEGLLNNLLATRIAFDNEAAGHLSEKPPAFFETLRDPDVLSDIAESLYERNRSIDGDIVNSQLGNLSSGRWTPSEVASRAFELVDEIKRKRQPSTQVGASPTKSAPPRRGDPRNLQEIATDIRQRLNRAAQTSQPPPSLAKANAEFQALISGEHDSWMLRQFESRLDEVLDPTRNLEIFHEVLVAAEAWAKLPNFLDAATSADRESGADKPRDRRQALELLLARVYGRGKVPPRSGGSDFDVRRTRQSQAVRSRFKVGPKGGEAEALARDADEFADLLFFHRAHAALVDCASTLSARGAEAEAYRLRQLLRSWPSSAARAWDAAQTAEGPQFLRRWSGTENEYGDFAQYLTLKTGADGRTGFGPQAKPDVEAVQRG